MKVHIVLSKIHENACFYFDLGPTLKKFVKALGDKIPDEDVVKRESRPHITVTYPMQDEQLLDLTRFLHENNMGRARCKFTRPMLFRNPDEIALVIGVESLDLQTMHKQIKRAFNIKTTWPDYKPHVTVAYLTSKAADRYENWDPKVEGHPFVVNRPVFEDTSAERVPIILGE